ncbi:MAG: Type 1 glutamine amidotransferase-like domain-containing protein [Chloroflexota bacterium]
MTGYILLEGGAEFSGRMAEPDQRAITLAGGSDAPIHIIPTAAAPDHNHQRAGGNAKRWFQGLGASHATVLHLIDADSANDLAIAEQLRTSRLIYLLGGFTHYLGETLRGSASWQAMMTAYQSGAVIAGSSAGAMVLCEWYYNPENQQMFQGLGLVTRACVLPHYDTFGHRWVQRLTALLPDAALLGIDERTGMLNDGGNPTERQWCVYGQGDITIHRKGQTQTYTEGDLFPFP